MRESKKRFLISILCLVLAFGLAAPSLAVLAVSRETQAEIDRLKDEKAKAEAEKKKAEQEKGNISSRKSATENYLKELEKQAGSLNEQISILEKDIAEKQAAVSAQPPGN